MQMLGGRGGMGGDSGPSSAGGYDDGFSTPTPRASTPAARPASKPAPNIADMDDDIPF